MQAARSKAELQVQKAKVRILCPIGEECLRYTFMIRNAVDFALRLLTSAPWIARKVIHRTPPVRHVLTPNACAIANSWPLREFSSKELHSVGNYTLGKLIGKGAFGKVYLATHKLTNGSKVSELRGTKGEDVVSHIRQVVLKSANKGDANLAREIHHHRQFLHPHIARLYEVIVTESLVWLVLEYCPGAWQYVSWDLFISADV